MHAQSVWRLPADWVPWYCADQRAGCVSPVRAAWLQQSLPACTSLPHGLVWNTQQMNLAQRSEILQSVLQRARQLGLLRGWRDERFSFWDANCIAPDSQREPLFAVERAGFRFLGLRSHAVHVNGFLADGRLWVARRSLFKATDPGMLDNVTAGGIASGESVHDGLRRELAEEAGLENMEGQLLEPAAWVATARLEPQGWHDEVLHVFNWTLSPEFVPCNVDGEVQGFSCLHPHEVLERVDAGEFTRDATLTLIQGLQQGFPIRWGV